MCFDRRSGGGVGAAWVFGSTGDRWLKQHLTIKGDKKRDVMGGGTPVQNPVISTEVQHNSFAPPLRTRRPDVKRKHDWSGCLPCLVNPLAASQEGGFCSG